MPLAQNGRASIELVQLRHLVPRGALRCLSLLLALTLLQTCARRMDPQATLDHATQTFRHGDVAAAEKEAKNGYEQFHGFSTEWVWKFQLLRAEALAWQGMNDRVLALLASETSRRPPMNWSFESYGSRAWLTRICTAFQRRSKRWGKRNGCARFLIIPRAST